jgi:hypothetical protein
MHCLYMSQTSGANNIPVRSTDMSDVDVWDIYLRFCDLDIKTPGSINSETGTVGAVVLLNVYCLQITCFLFSD